MPESSIWPYESIHMNCSKGTLIERFENGSVNKMTQLQVSLNLQDQSNASSGYGKQRMRSRAA